MAEVGPGGNCSGTDTCGKDPATGRYLVCYNGRCTTQEDSLAYTAAFGAIDAAKAANPGNQDWIDASTALTRGILRGDSIATYGLTTDMLFEISTQAPTFAAWATSLHHNSDAVRANTLLSLAGNVPVFDPRTLTVTNYQPVGNPIEQNRVPPGLVTDASLALVGHAVQSLGAQFVYLPPQPGSQTSQKLALFLQQTGGVTTDRNYTANRLALAGTGGTADKTAAQKQATGGGGGGGFGGLSQDQLLLLGALGLLGAGAVAFLLVRKPARA